MSKLEKFLQKSGLTFEEYKNWFCSLQVGDRVSRNNLPDDRLHEVKESHDGGRSITFHNGNTYTIKEKQVFYFYEDQDGLAACFPTPDAEQIKEIVEKRLKEEEVFDLKPGQKYETKDGRIFVVRHRREDSDLWSCSDVSFPTFRWSYLSTGKLELTSKYGSDLDFVKLLPEESENKQLEVSKNETKKKEDKMKAISFVFDALYQTEDGSKVRCTYVGKESGARMTMVEGQPCRKLPNHWDFFVDTYGIASVPGLNIVGLWKEAINLKIGQKYRTKSGFIVDVKFQEDGFFICGEGLWRYNNQGKLEPDTENGELDFVELVQEVENTDSRKIQEVSSKYEKACVENYELRKVVEDLQAKLANAKSSELKAQTDLNKTLDDFEKLEERIFILKQAEKNLLDSLDNKTKIINQLQRNGMGLEDYIRELKDRNAALENKLSSIKQLFKSV